MGKKSTAKAAKPDRDDLRIARVGKDGQVQVNPAIAARVADPQGRKPERAALGSDLEALQDRFARDIAGSIWIPEGASADEKAHLANGALSMFARLDPRDEAEAMLAVQMVASHSSAMECYRRAMLVGQTFEGRDASLKHAAKLSALYERQLAAYDKRRGKRDQTVVVKHVTVKEGGQAILGDVHTGGKVSGADQGAIGRRDGDAWDPLLDGERLQAGEAAQGALPDGE